ncbi:MAG: M23 family metallopeptidase [Armatimonadota bacterium]|nr:M23 family metallopeptidase [Armatimonadota bacterium]
MTPPLTIGLHGPHRTTTPADEAAARLAAGPWGNVVLLHADTALVDALAAAAPQLRIAVRMYSQDRMARSAALRAAEDAAWCAQHPFVRDLIPANELNLALEHAWTPGDWASAEGYAAIGQWLLAYLEAVRPLLPHEVRIHFPALAPTPEELHHLPLLETVLERCDVVDLHTYGDDDVSLRLARYREYTDRPVWITETNAGAGRDQLAYLRATWTPERLRSLSRRGVIAVSWFLAWSDEDQWRAFALLGTPLEPVWTALARERYHGPMELTWPVRSPRAVTSDAQDHIARGAAPALDIVPLGRPAAGEPVLAAADGVVTEMTREGYSAWGTYVRLRHEDGTETGYAHLMERSVAPGQGVRAGEPVGTMGATGQATGPHLHLELWVEGERVDPLPHLVLEPPPPAEDATPSPPPPTAVVPAAVIAAFDRIWAEAEALKAEAEALRERAFALQNALLVIKDHLGLP